MSWKPAKTATAEQTARAVALLRSGDWQLGKVWSDPNDPNVQYRAAMHPNVGKPGTHPGVEVWERIADGSEAITPVENERDMVLREFERRGWPRDEANAMIAIESGWDAKAHNKQGFGGLIGFAPGLQHQWGVWPIWSARPSIASQAPLVGRYLDEVVAPMGKRWKVPGDTYLTGAAPAYVGAPDSQVVYRRGTKAWEQNPGWRGADGEITAGSIRAVVLRKMAHLKGGGPPVAAGPKDATALPAPEPSQSDTPTPPSCGSASSVPPSGFSRGRAAGAASAAIAAIGAALQAATDNPWLVLALVVHLVLVLLLLLWLTRKKR